jgi:uncharacterized phage protein gp47/JayE
VAGLTSAGFVRKTHEEVKAEMDADVRADISTTVNTSSAGVIGQLLGIVASQLSELWELAEEVWAAAYPDSASGASLVEVASLTGTVPSAGTRSRVYVTIVTDADDVTLPALTTVVSVAGSPTVRFRLIAEHTVLFAGGTWLWFESEEIGEIHANAGTLTVIETPIAGWTAAYNGADAELGEVADDDAALRRRRSRELAAQGASPADALAADLRRVTLVTSVTVLENTLDVADGAGRPPHSFEALVLGGADADIAAVIWADKAAGIASVGTTDVTVLDAEGNAQTVSFSRPTEREVYIDVDVEIDASLYPSDGDDQIAQAIADWGDANLQVSTDVYISRVSACAFAVAGVVNVTAVRMGFTVDPAGTSNLSIGAREIARFDTARIVVAEV